MNSEKLWHGVLLEIRETENGINLEIIGDKSPRVESYIHGIDGCMDLRIFDTIDSWCRGVIEIR